ncbi:hypothetical protein BKA62DRAFT_771574 [Auriculariales sp. MPI-PUGE-AT-0066]|nr:hypothetical protein BKA62DRAFT_771574 [Auriculariales sp. MPI-PUGE-AT-0066]
MQFTLPQVSEDESPLLVTRGPRYSAVTLATVHGDALTPATRTYGGPRAVRITRVTPENAARYNDSPNQSAFISPVMSRQHARISFGDCGQVYLMDLHSHHGTTVERAGVLTSLTPNARHRLETDDIVTFGKTVVKDTIPHDPVVLRVAIRPVIPQPQVAPEATKISPGRYGLFDSEDSSSSSESESDDHKQDSSSRSTPAGLAKDRNASSDSENDRVTTKLPNVFSVNVAPPSLPRFADYFGKSGSGQQSVKLQDEIEDEDEEEEEDEDDMMLESEDDSPLVANIGYGQDTAEERIYGGATLHEVGDVDWAPTSPIPPVISYSPPGDMLQVFDFDIDGEFEWNALRDRVRSSLGDGKSETDVVEREPSVALTSEVEHDQPAAMDAPAPEPEPVVDVSAVQEDEDVDADTRIRVATLEECMRRRVDEIEDLRRDVDEVRRVADGALQLGMARDNDVDMLRGELEAARAELKALKDDLSMVSHRVTTLAATTTGRKRKFAELDEDIEDIGNEEEEERMPEVSRVVEPAPKRRFIRRAIGRGAGLVAASAVGVVATYVGLAFL